MHNIQKIYNCFIILFSLCYSKNARSCMFIFLYVTLGSHAEKVVFGCRNLVVCRTTGALFLVVRRMFWWSRANGQPKFRTLVENCYSSGSKVRGYEYDAKVPKMLLNSLCVRCRLRTDEKAEISFFFKIFNI